MTLMHRFAFAVPLVLAGFTPFASFAAENVGEAMSLGALLVYALCVILVGFVLALAFSPFGRNAVSRAGFTVSVLTFLFFCFPVVEYLVGGTTANPYLVHGALAVMSGAAAWKLAGSRRAYQAWTAALLVMIGTSLAAYGARWSQLERTPSLPDQGAVRTGNQPFTGSAINRRNVYYLTLDGYPRADALQEFFGFDNSDFIKFLKSKGFSVSDRSYANYMGTYLSVSAALERSFVVDESDENLWSKVRWFQDLIRGNNALFKHLHELGYFIAKLDFLDECKGPYVDYCHGTDKQQTRIDLRLTELEFSLLRLTPLYELATQKFARILHPRLGVKGIDHVIDMVKYLNAPNPKMFFAHVLLPHLPYRFDAECAPTKEIDAKTLDDIPRAKQLFMNQTHCANRRTKEFVELVVRQDPDAIVLVNSDHGAPFVDWSLPYERWPAAAVRQRFGILNAMRLPNECKSLFYDDISPVNFFELVLACIERRTPNLKEDRIYISTFDKNHRQYGKVWRYR